MTMAPRADVSPGVRFVVGVDEGYGISDGRMAFTEAVD
jgi:hypothetical protein